MRETSCASLRNSVLRIVTLRDEGIALSVVEGTAAFCDSQSLIANSEYFEIDAPKTTLAAEKKGLYRVDVPREGRVRLTVRDGGSARIYSDTSGFALRDGRSAELIVTGETAGDWEFLAAAPRDAIDDWVNDRERYLAQRLKHDVKYYDEYVWGAEDLDAYGDWNYTDDFGWIWRPRATVISATTTGRRIATDIGPGVRLMAGPGSDMSHGVGRLITTAAGFTTTTTGPGCRVAGSTESAVGGDQRSWRVQHLIRQRHLLVSVVVLPARSTFASLSSRRPPAL